MEVTEVRVYPVDSNPTSEGRLLAFCSVTFDHVFVVRDLKVIEAMDGMFVAMPSKIKQDSCPFCRGRNPVRAKFCSYCGESLDDQRYYKTSGAHHIYQDIAHPVNLGFRLKVEDAVLDEYDSVMKLKQVEGNTP